jgi:electron transport complex protein RnfD
MTEEKSKIEKNEDTPSVMLPDPKELVVSTSPHLHGGESVKKIMYIVIISLLPACAAGVYFFGMDALRVLLLCTIFCVGIEMIWCKLASKKQTWTDGSAVITGLLLGMNLSAGVPWWLCLVGALLAIILGKQLFGGLGYNPFNPALVARVGLLIGFPKLMTTWVVPKNFSYMMDPAAKFVNSDQLAQLQSLGGSSIPFNANIEGLTCATPLGIVSTAAGTGTDPFQHVASPEALQNYFWGNVGGCIGETSVAFLLLGAALLFAYKLIRWQVPFAYIGTVALITFLMHKFDPTLTPGPVFHIVAGGLIIGAFFMATDMVTSPMTTKGAFIFGTGCGIITCAIRIWGSYPEGVSFSILFMNALTPLIDRYSGGKPFGYKKKELETKKA